MRSRWALLGGAAVVLAAAWPSMTDAADRAKAAAPVDAGAPGDAAADTPAREVELYRQAREKRLRSETGWLSLVGLYWLTEGPHTFGSGAGVALVLPAGDGVPAHAGVFTLKKDQVSVRLQPGVTATVAGKPITEMVLRPDDPGPPDVVVMGSLSLQVIRRAGQLGIRVKDTQSARRRTFTGLRWFPINPAYRVTARFVPHDKPVSITFASAAGPPQPLSSPGAAVFSLGGRELRLDAVLEEPTDDQLFFIFRDQTAGNETYGAGRFLYTPLPKDGQVVLDFNKAFSPPCAFTPYATCPLPPRQNRLPIRVEAGERAPEQDKP